jgi:ribonuclease Z
MTEKINITFLGTSQAIPTARRNHTSILLHYKDENILIDCGEGTQRQFRKAKLNPCKLTKLLITHWHGDHILGIAGLLQTLLLNSYNKILNVYGPKGTGYYWNRIIDLLVPYNKIKVKIHEVSESKFFENKDFYLEAISMQHGIPCNAYAFVEKAKLRLNKEKLRKLKLKGPIIAELAKGKDIIINNKKIHAKNLIYKTQERKITFIFDTKINNNCHKIAKDSNAIVSEAVYLENEKDLAKLHEHLTACQAAEIAKQSGKKLKALYLSHLSQRYDGSEKLILNEAKKHFKNTIIAEDLMQIEI